MKLKFTEGLCSWGQLHQKVETFEACLSSDIITAQEHPDLGPCTAHAGMLSCAAAVWEDLERHGILETLLHPAPEDSNDGSSSGSRGAGEDGSSSKSAGGGGEVKSDGGR